MIELFGLTIGQQDVVIGLVTGLTYAAFAAGFLLVYRSTGVLNFAHGETGAFSVALFVMLLVNYDVNWWLAFALSVLAGAAIGMVTELIVVRRLFDAPRLVLLIATIGMSQVLVFSKISLPKVVTGGSIPLPFDVVWEPTGDLRILARELVVVLVVPTLIVALALFMTRTRFGLAVRASASNPDTARVFGTSPRRTSTVVWTISGALAATTAILIAPLQGINAAQAGTAAIAEPLLLRVLAVSLLARMRSLPRALAAGLAVGVVEQLVRSNVASSNRSVVDLYLFLAVLVVVVYSGRSRIDDSWSLSPRTRPVPERLRSVWWVARLPVIGFSVLFGFFALLPLVVTSPSGTFIWTNILVWSMVTLSVTVLTGWAGQLSLGQFALVGVGGLTTLALTAGHDIPIPFDLFDASLELPWFVALVGGTAVGVVMAVLVGLPALRVKGLFLAVTTLAFAVAAASWLFIQDFFTGGTSSPRPPDKPVLDWGPIEIDFNESRRAYYYLCLVALGISAVMVARLRRTGSGRSMIAVRENEDMAAASTVSPSRMKLTAFALSGGIAAFAGGLFVTLQPSLQPTSSFQARESLDVVATAIIGGLGTVAGPMLGTLWVRGLPEFIPQELDDLVRLLTSDIGLLLLLMYFPGGLLQVVYKLRDVAFEHAERRLPEASTTGVATIERAVPTRPARPAAGAAAAVGPALEVRDVTVRFGGNVAVDGVSLHVERGELVGLIGTNGAGKSTLLNAISGFVRCDGHIAVMGCDVSSMSAARRHAEGLGRGFQSARLYPDLTVRESIMVALEARERSLLVPSMTGLPPSRRVERRKRAEADELVNYLGLGRYADHYIATLSTGTRRIVELGSLLAVDARVLLLDEPTGGIAQRETEAFGPLIKRIQRELDAAVLVIEHDMPLIMAISDRVYCLETGTVIAEGTPEVIRRDPAVVASYLGTDERAIDRSDSTRA